MLSVTVYTASPVHTCCLWHLAHARRAYSTLCVHLTDIYIAHAAPSRHVYTYDTFPAHVYTYGTFLAHIYAHTTHARSIRHLTHACFHPPYMGSHTQLHTSSKSQPHTLPVAHTRHPVHNTLGAGGTLGPQGSPALPILCGGGRKGQGYRDRNWPAKLNFQTYNPCH